MAAMQEQSFCVLEYAKCSSVTSVQHAFLRKYRKAAPGHLQYVPETWGVYVTLHVSPVFSSARPSPRVRSPTENIGERFMVKEESAASVGTDLGRPREEV
ncbi:hypothetical protein AVEN_182420-1 [Araneus ventricosus]|uniref:DUF4817 domain-containing protein n=1 Tax=Araneus ventricosus TaxID=182803 RepID=A0A4Y2DX64_ARAVE|nr:hypothetical protein AVEN_182420-1 [Araneus ventricosus]